MKRYLNVAVESLFLYDHRVHVPLDRYYTAPKLAMHPVNCRCSGSWTDQSNQAPNVTRELTGLLNLTLYFYWSVIF